MSNSILTRQQITSIAEQWINEINTKHIDVGCADNQPKWPYWVKPCNYSRKEWDDMGVWMVKTFGNGDWMMDGLWVGSDRKYWFREERDRTLFLLKWS